MDTMHDIGAEVHWLPHERNVADAPADDDASIGLSAILLLGLLLLVCRTRLWEPLSRYIHPYRSNPDSHPHKSTYC